MRVAIINCFETYEIREKMIYEFFKNRGDIVTLIKSDFLHMKKEYIELKNSSNIYIHVNSYKKNLSLKRLKSHNFFSKSVLSILKNSTFDLVYVLIPPNSLVKDIAKYKQLNPHCILFFDVIDLWPETMPLGKIKSIFPFTLWKGIRNNYINFADQIITECNLFNFELKKYVDSKKINTIYFCRHLNQLNKEKELNDNEINLCYLGSINNIIDIHKIGNLINKIAKVRPVTLKIIGDGENKKELIETVKAKGATVVDYGKVYDQREKQKIFNTCDYGLNIYKDDTFIGVTMKSIDYLDGGLPLINTIKGDTEEFINMFKCGFNYEDFNENQLRMDRILEYTINTKKVMEKYFDITCGYFNLEKILSKFYDLK